MNVDKICQRQRKGLIKLDVISRDYASSKALQGFVLKVIHLFSKLGSEQLKGGVATVVGLVDVCTAREQAVNDARDRVHVGFLGRLGGEMRRGFPLAIAGVNVETALQQHTCDVHVRKLCDRIASEGIGLRAGCEMKEGVITMISYRAQLVKQLIALLYVAFCAGTFIDQFGEGGEV